MAYGGELPLLGNSPFLCAKNIAQAKNLLSEIFFSKGN
jgi:hypothetical protein